MDLKYFFDILVESKNTGQKIRLEPGQLEVLNPIDRVKLLKVKNQLNRILELKFEKGKKYRIHKTKKAFDGKRSYLIGLAFENLINVIFEQSLVFSLQERVKTDASEIDFFVHIIQPYSALFAILNPHQRLFGEAKCHATAAKSEWVNTLVGKMVSNDTRLGMIFTFNKMGPAPSPFRIAVKDHHRSNPPAAVVPWGISLIDELLSGKSFLSLIQIQNNLAFVGATNLTL